MTLLSVCQGAMSVIGEYEIPGSIVGNENQTAVKLLAAAKLEVSVLASLAQWQRLTTEYTFATVASTATYALPSDYDYIINDTVWDRTYSRMCNGPIGAQDWQALKASQVTVAIDKKFRIFGNLFYIYPTPDAVATIAYEYISTSNVESSGGTGQTNWQADTDVARLPELVIQLGLQWRYLKSMGLPYQDELNEYITTVQRAISRDGGKPKLRMGRSSLQSMLMLPNTPESGFG